MKKKLCFLFVLFSLSSGFALTNKDQASIQAIMRDIQDSWNKEAGYGFADHYAKEADFINIFGTYFLGKIAIEKRHVEILETFFKGSTFKILDVKLREPKPGIVIALLFWEVTDIPKTEKPLPETLKGVFTHTLVKKKKKWEITASQNTLIK